MRTDTHHLTFTFPLPYPLHHATSHQPQHSITVSIRHSNSFDEQHELKSSGLPPRSPVPYFKMWILYLLLGLNDVTLKQFASDDISRTALPVIDRRSRIPLRFALRASYSRPLYFYRMSLAPIVEGHDELKMPVVTIMFLELHLKPSL